MSPASFCSRPSHDCPAEGEIMLLLATGKISFQNFQISAVFSTCCCFLFTSWHLQWKVRSCLCIWFSISFNSYLEVTKDKENQIQRLKSVTTNIWKFTLLWPAIIIVLSTNSAIFQSSDKFSLYMYLFGCIDINYYSR